MQKMTEEMKDILRSNISYFGTVSRDEQPNVVPVGLIEPISDSEVLIGDVRFHKTRKNLEGNPHVALSVTDVKRVQAYQFKGNATIFTSGPYFERIMEKWKVSHEERTKKMQERLNQAKDAHAKKRYEQLIERHHQIKLKAAVLITINEIYNTMGV